MVDVTARALVVTTLGLACQREDGRWIVGQCAGPGGTHPIVLPPGTDPSAISADALQSSIDGASDLAQVKAAKARVILVRDTWLPIEHAPDDGRVLLVRRDSHEWSPRVTYHHNGEWLGLVLDGDCDWIPFHRPPTH